MMEKQDWHEYFTTEKVEAILSGQKTPARIVSAFIFDSTPEGHAYWDGISKLDTLSDEARARLIAMINEHYAWRAYMRLRGEKVDR